MEIGNKEKKDMYKIWKAGCLQSSNHFPPNTPIQQYISPYATLNIILIIKM